MTETRFYVMAKTTGGMFYNNQRNKDGYATLEEAKKNFNTDREVMNTSYTGVSSSETKWFILQTVMAIPMVAPPQYSFEPLQLAGPESMVEPAPIARNWSPDDEIPF